MRNRLPVIAPLAVPLLACTRGPGDGIGQMGTRAVRWVAETSNPRDMTAAGGR